MLGEDWPASAEAAEAAELAGAAAAAVDLPGPAARGGQRRAAGARRRRTWRSGRRSPRCGSTAATGTSRRWLQREIDGVAAHVLAAAAGRSTREWLQRARGWDDAAWDDAAARLHERGWLDGDELSAEGLAMVAADRGRHRPAGAAARGRRSATPAATGWPIC